MRKERIKSEIQLADDECCIVFDFGCYFPYANQEILSFGFSLGTERFEDYKLNHRYPNTGYRTISKKYGRKISKLGYPYIMKLDKQGIMFLCIEVGLKGECLKLIFPIETRMTKESPACGLSLHYFFDRDEFCFTSYENVERGHGRWHQHNWSNYELQGIKGKNNILLDTPCRPDDTLTLRYDTIITPYPSALEDLLI